MDAFTGLSLDLYCFCSKGFCTEGTDVIVAKKHTKSISTKRYLAEEEVFHRERKDGVIMIHNYGKCFFLTSTTFDGMVSVCSGVLEYNIVPGYGT